MITCKEDLRNTQASGDLVVPFQELAFKLGIGWSPNGNDMVVRENYGVIVCRDFGHGLELAHRHNLKEGLKRLTLSDLKPTKQYAVLHKGGSYSFQSDMPIGNDVVACFDLERSEKPLSDDFFDENRQDDKQMKTYNTYQEAKIANPECEIAVKTKKAADDFGDAICFQAVVADSSWSDGYAFSDDEDSSPRISDGYWKICNPADYCITVKEFLSVGHKFEAGDLWIDYDGDFMTVGNLGVNHMNKPHERDFERYILRAAALEKPKRTKVEFVKVEFKNVGECVQSVHDNYGEYFFFNSSSGGYQASEYQDSAWHWKDENLYRRIETPVTEREAFIDEAIDITGANENSNAHHAFALLFDSGKFKLVN